MRSSCLILLISILVAGAGSALSQTPAGDDATRLDATHYARQLSVGDAPTRQAAAEALARLAAIEQKKLVEGYVLQEKDKRVRLALNWALYRMGKSETLFQIVHELETSRYDQALDYLTQLDSPDPLYPFLSQQNTAPKITQRVLQVLGERGNAETVDKINPLLDHYDPQVAAAAKVAAEQIQNRLSQPQPDVKTRARVVTKSKEP